MSVPIGEWPAIHATRFPHRLAFVDGITGKQTNYKDFDDRTTRLASALRQNGIEAGDRVAVFCLNSVEMLEVLFATAKLSAITVFVNFRLTAPEVHYILKDSGATLLFTSSSLLETAQQAAADTEVHTVITIPMAAQRLDTASGSADDSDDAQRSAGDFEAFLAAGESDIELPKVDPDSPALLMYTSGTTGTPKGAIITHTNLFFDAIYHNHIESGLNSTDVCVAAAPLFHIGALALYTLPAVYWGASSVVLESFDPESWAAAVEQYQATKAFCVPAMWQALLTSGAFDRHDTSRLDTTLSGGAPCPITVIEGIVDKGVAFTEGYGLTETTAATTLLPSELIRSHSGTVGRPMAHVRMRIVDPLGEDVPTGEVGEVIVSGPSVSPGYWNRPEATEEAFRDGWFHTGDLGTVDEEGIFRIVDRKKDMVITGGENVYPIEIEQVLYRHPAIAEVSVYGTADEKWGETVTAAVVLAAGQESADEVALAADITAFARQQLAGFKVPRRFVFLAELPRTATGKVRKIELRAAGVPPQANTAGAAQ